MDIKYIDDAISNGESYSLAELEGMIGGSTLDDLRDLAGIDSLTDGCIEFVLIAHEDIDLTQNDDGLNEFYGINPRETFVAKCMHDMSYYLYNGSIDDLAWDKI